MRFNSALILAAASIVAATPINTYGGDSESSVAPVPSHYHSAGSQSEGGYAHPSGRPHGSERPHFVPSGVFPSGEGRPTGYPGKSASFFGSHAGHPRPTGGHEGSSEGSESMPTDVPSGNYRRQDAGETGRPHSRPTGIPSGFPSDRPSGGFEGKGHAHPTGTWSGKPDFSGSFSHPTGMPTGGFQPRQDAGETEHPHSRPTNLPSGFPSGLPSGVDGKGFPGKPSGAEREHERPTGAFSGRPDFTGSFSHPTAAPSGGFQPRQDGGEYESRSKPTGMPTGSFSDHPRPSGGFAHPSGHSGEHRSHEKGATASLPVPTGAYGNVPRQEAEPTGTFSGHERPSGVAQGSGHGHSVHSRPTALPSGAEGKDFKGHAHGSDSPAFSKPTDAPSMMPREEAQPTPTGAFSEHERPSGAARGSGHPQFSGRPTAIPSGANVKEFKGHDHTFSGSFSRPTAMPTGAFPPQVSGQ